MNLTQTILLVEDREDDRTLMKSAMIKAHFPAPIQMVDNGQDAIAYLKGEGNYNDRSRYPLPGVILLDLNLPMINGLTVLAWIRSHPKLKRIPVIIWTASSRDEDVERAFELGAAGFLVKPVAVGALITMTMHLRDWLEMNRFPSIE